VATSVCPPPLADQRGVARSLGPACDIGAFEFVPNKDRIRTNHPISQPVGPAPRL
jgi:hypothetical protein